VRKRTADLETVNARLASEIARRRIDQATMAEREARLAQAAQLAKLGYYIWNFDDQRFEVCSDAHAAAHGLSRAEFMAASEQGEMRITDTHPDDLERRRKKIADLESGLPIELDYRVVTPNGVRRLRESARPIFDDRGLVVRGVGSTLDLTDQYETEMKLYEAQRMDSIGKMTGGVAHDFNNLLAVILGNLELLSEHPDIEDRDEMIGDAIRATLRGRDLTMSMLSFARRAPMDPSKLDLNAVIAELQSMLRRTLPITINLQTELNEEIWPIMADRSLTESAVLNLAINAMDAMPAGGTLTLRTQNVVLDRKEAAQIKGDLDPGPYVKMSVRDTGNGIEANLIENIFEPFFTTKSITKNSGLGLSMVQGFIQQTGGGIRATSSPEQGALFELYFRSALGAQEEDQAVRTDTAPEHTKKPLRVLLVEDDSNVRKVLARQMEQTGMTVISAAESTSAQSAFASQGPFDVVVSDIVMPGELQGPALVRRLRETDSTLPAVFLSGYPRDIAEHGDGVSIDDVMLMKPVGRDDLLIAIDCAMNPGRDVIKDLTPV
jgi:signal transduction histidine kinase/ActR/RegA family two-component response regulator